MIDSYYSTEQALVDGLCRSLFQLFPSTDIILREIRAQDGVADVVCARTTSLSRFRRLRTHVRHDCTDRGCGVFYRQLASRPELVFDDVVAIEAKLFDWSKGLYQASRYRAFAHRTYLAIGKEGAFRAYSVRREFRKAGVGLIVVGEQCRILLASPWRPIARDSTAVNRSTKSAL